MVGRAMVLAAGALFAGATAAQAAPERGAVYGGANRDDQPIVVELSSSRRSVTRLVNMTTARCTSGAPYWGTRDRRGRLPIDRRGRWSGDSNGTENLADGQVAKWSDTYRGRVVGRRVTGRVTNHVEIMNAQGQVVDVCDVKYSFEAISSPGVVFGGATSQRAPVVLTRRRDRQAVGIFAVGWRATCRSGGFVQLSGYTTNVPLRRGRFADGGEDETRHEDGTTAEVRVPVRGRLGSRAGSGTLQGTYTERNADGTATDECSSGPVTWKVASG